MSDHSPCWHIIKTYPPARTPPYWSEPSTFVVVCCHCVHDQQPLKKGSPIADVIQIPVHQPLEE